MVNSMRFLVFFPLHETFCETIPFHFCYNSKKNKKFGGLGLCQLNEMLLFICL